MGGKSGAVKMASFWLLKSEPKSVLLTYIVFCFPVEGELNVSNSTNLFGFILVGSQWKVAMGINQF